MHLVVANELHSRKDRVWLVARGQVGGWGSRAQRAGAGQSVHPGATAACCCRRVACALPHEAAPTRRRMQDGAQAVQRIERPEGVAQIETLLVAEVVAAHAQHMKGGGSNGGGGPAAAAAAAGQMVQ